MSHELSDFQLDVLDRSHHLPVLVDFWAPWCGPCKMLTPVLERLVADAAGRWALIKVNTDEEPALAERYGIRGIPNLKLFHRGAVVAELAGAVPEPQLRQWLEEHLPGHKRDAMAHARQLLGAGHANEAAGLLQPLANAEPDDQELAALTARALMFNHPEQAFLHIAEIEPGSPWDDEAQLVRAILAAFGTLDRQADNLPPTPVRDRYLGALVALRQQDFRAAAAGLVEVLLEKPNYDDGRAKSACRALFRHLGLRHPVSEEFARAYSMAVNV